jgi:hypothetical protein
MKKDKKLFRQPLTDRAIALAGSENSQTPRLSDWPHETGAVTLPKAAENATALWEQVLAPSTRANPHQGRSIH